MNNYFLINELNSKIYDKRISKNQKEKMIHNLIKHYLDAGRQDLAIEVSKAFEKLENFEKYKKDLKRNGWL